NRSISSVGLIHGNTQGSPRRLRPSCALGVRRQTGGKVFDAARIKRLEEIFRSVCTDFEAVLKEFNGEPDHVHLLVNYPPKVRLSEVMNSLKGVSSRRMKQEFPAISTFWSVRKNKGHLWSPSYFVGSVGGAPITILRQYIEGQNRPSAGAL